MDIRGILFDLDNTLVDRYKSILMVAGVFRENFFDRLKKISLEELQDKLAEADCNGYRPKRDVFKDIIEMPIWQKRPSVDEILMFWDNEFGKCTKPAEGMYEVLDFFLDKKISMGIITNGSVHRQNLKIDCLGIRKYMKTIIISEEIGIEKPDPVIFETALRDIGLEPRNTMFVGDNPKLDIQGSRNCGLTPVWVSWNKQWEIDDVEPELTIPFLKEIIEMFN